MIRSNTMSIVIWHNPRCSKSRETLALIRARGIEPAVRLYLEDPPDAATLKATLAKLGMEPRQLLRSKEDLCGELGLNAEGRSEDEILQAMVEHPRLIERPVVIAGERA